MMHKVVNQRTGEVVWWEMHSDQIVNVIRKDQIVNDILSRDRENDDRPERFGQKENIDADYLAELDRECDFIDPNL